MLLRNKPHTFTPWSLAKSQPLKVSLSGQNRWQSEEAWWLWRMLHLRVQLAEAFSGVGGSIWTCIIAQQCGTFRQQSSASGSSNWFQVSTGSEAFHYTDTVYNCASVLVVFQDWPLYSPLPKWQHHFPASGYVLNCVSTGSIKCFHSILWHWLFEA
jgi:hypothetical protein